MVKSRLAGVAGLALAMYPAVSMAYYEENLSSGGGTEIEIIDQGLPAIQNEVVAQDLPASVPTAIEQDRQAQTNTIDGKPAKREGPLTSYVGSGKAKPVSCRGNNLPLKVAVAMVLPKGWDVIDGPLAKGKKVTFSALKKPWTLVIEDMGKKTHTPVAINWRNGTVTLGKKSALQNEPPRQSAGNSTGRDVIVRKAFLNEPGRADAVARRFKIDEKDFCRWNQVGPSAWLARGYEVLLEEPPAGAIIIANITAGPTDPMAGKKLPPIPENVSASSGIPMATPAVYTPDDPAPSYGNQEEGISQGHVYSLSPGSLYSQLAKWCANAGYELVWKVGGDYDITSFSAFGTDFKTSLTQLFNSLMNSGEPLRATVYERNHVVEVTGE